MSDTAFLRGVSKTICSPTAERREPLIFDKSEPLVRNGREEQCRNCWPPVCLLSLNHDVVTGREEINQFCSCRNFPEPVQIMVQPDEGTNMMWVGVLCGQLKQDFFVI